MCSWLNVVHVTLIAALLGVALFAWTSHLGAGPETLDLTEDTQFE
ncbi:hypothetical protein [Roseivivax sp. THAF30]|nr:hypothetical protein [Roseivivax sp. THAF30]QFT64829.1 hypothetical protein FIU91_17970 [Roseivivax sp. THAF30]